MHRHLRFALRRLRKTPVFALTAILTLALCIGVSTIIFSLVDTLLIRPLPYPEPERLGQVVMHVHGPDGEGMMEAQTGAVYEMVRDRGGQADVAAESMVSGVNLAANGHVEFVQQHRVSTRFFSVIGIPPLIGREFTAEEDKPGGPAAVVLSYTLWRRIFQADPSLLGKPVMLRGETYTVVGVMPPGFQPPMPADVWTPLRPSRTGEGGGANYGLIARLHPGVTWAQAQAGLEPLSREAATADEISPDVPARLTLMPLQEASTSAVRQVLFVLWAAVATVLLIGCVNIAGLLLAQGARRTHEIATRMALGAGRAAVIRQLLAESLVLALIGGALGILLAYLGLSAITPILQPGLGISQTVRIDWRVLSIAFVLTVLTSIIFGLFPSWRASRADIRDALVEGSGHGIVSARSHWPRRLLLVFEVTLGVLLLNGATQFTRTFLHLAGLAPGFDGNGVLTASLSLQDARYREAAKVSTLFDETLRRIRALPGVTYAAVSLSLPYQRALNMGFRVLDGPDAGRQPQPTNLTYVTPGYFETFRIQLLRGRMLSESDRAGAPLVALVNAAFVRHYLPNQEAPGTHIRISGRVFEIVGVVSDVLQRSSWGNYGPIEALPGMFITAAQTTDGFVQLVHTWFSPHWIVRTGGRTEGLIAGMQNALAATDALLPFSSFESMGEVRSFALAQYRFQALMVDSFAALGLLLSAIGLCGLIAANVAERWREMGLRIALGARVGRTIRDVAMPGIVLTVAGLALGSLLAYPAMRAVETLVWGIEPSNPMNFMIAGLVLLVAALIASFAPAVRLRRLNMATTLREG